MVGSIIESISSIITLLEATAGSIRLEMVEGAEEAAVDSEVAAEGFMEEGEMAMGEVNLETNSDLETKVRTLDTETEESLNSKTDQRISYID